MRTQNAVRSTHASASMSSSFRLCLFVRVWLRVPESRVNWGSGVLGGGEPYSGGRRKEGRGFQKPRAFRSAEQCLDNQTADQ